jgi:hypothetical protein
VLKNSVLRKIFGRKKDEVTDGCRKLNNQELHSLYSSPNTIRMRQAGHVERMGVMRNARRILVRKREGKRALGRPRQMEIY